MSDQITADVEAATNLVENICSNLEKSVQVLNKCKEIFDNSEIWDGKDKEKFKLQFNNLNEINQRISSQIGDIVEKYKLSNEELVNQGQELTKKIQYIYR